jgi:nucleoside-diphosphate-sugar epimerase
MARPARLTVAVTGPTGTFGFALLPLLEAAPEVGKVVGVARRPFDPAEHGWTKLEYRRGDVRDPDLLAEAFRGADVVVHLAFLITGTSSRSTTRDINVTGTLNAFRAAAAAGADRFVYASSVAAYGFHPDNPIGMSEDWPTRPADHLFYAQEKAELEEVLAEEAAAHEDVGLYLLRPPIVVGPHVVGAKSDLVERLLPAATRAMRLAKRSPLRVPLIAPDLELQLIHEDDVATALLACALGQGPPGAYNIAGDGTITGAQLVQELGFAPIRLPSGVLQGVARRIAGLPMPGFVPPVAGWAEALSSSSIVDTTKAKRDLGWTPRYSSLQALRATIDPMPDQASRSDL